MEKSFHYNSHSRPLAAILNFLSEQLTTIGATGDTGARYRCCRSQKISIISLRHRRCSYIVTSMEDIERTRMAISSISRQNVSNNFQSLNILLHDVVILDPISYAQDLVLLS